MALPRILVKIDVEKAYNTLSWSAILATLTKMNFPNIWISGIRTCISSTSFSFLISGQSIPWIKSFRGVRQGDPILSYLFILVSQNLTSMLNFALRQGMITGYNNNLSYKFNHLMYVDDLILISQASRLIARNIKLCLHIYGQLSGQHILLSWKFIVLLGLINGAQRVFAPFLIFLLLIFLLLILESLLLLRD